MPRKEIQIAGANGAFSCETASSQSPGRKTVCAAWKAGRAFLLVGRPRHDGPDRNGLRSGRQTVVAHLGPVLITRTPVLPSAPHQCSSGLPRSALGIAVADPHAP